MNDLKININDNKQLETLKGLEAGTFVKISGKLLTARDSAHKKIIQSENSTFKDILNNKIIYYMGPTPARDGYPIGSCGPTSSYRMDKFYETTLKYGIAGTIGKGERSDEVTELCKKYRVPYFITIGGAAAYLANCVISSEVILFEELGPEAIRELKIIDFPVFVSTDIYGNTLNS